VDIPEVDEYLLYLRRSNGRKAVPRQRAITTAHIAKLGGLVIGEFADADRTAFRKIDGDQPERKGFTAMLQALRSRPGLKVAAWHADRLTRNAEDTEELIRVCASGGNLVVTASGGSYDLSTANGRKQFRADANDAAYEVDHGRERVLEARAEVAADGRWLGGKRPFAWERVPNPLHPDGTAMLDEDGEPVKGILRLRQAEADALAQAHRDVLDGATVASVARDWNTRGIRTPTGKQWRGREVTRVLKRPRNAGLMEYRGEIIATARKSADGSPMVDEEGNAVTSASWPPVVDEVTWRAVVAILDDPNRKTTPGPARRHLLTFLAKCGVCGGPVICTSTSKASSKGRERRLVYRCREDTRGHVARDTAAVDDLVTRLLIARLSLPDAAKLLVKDHGDELASLHREEKAIRELMAADRRLQLEGLLSEIEFRAGRKKFLADLAAIEHKIATAGQADVLTPLVYGDARQVWASYTLDKRRAVVNAAITITIMPAPKGRPKGWTPGKPYFDPRSVQIRWRRDPS